MKKLFAAILSISLFLSCFGVAFSNTAGGGASGGGGGGVAPGAPVADSSYEAISEIVSSISAPNSGLDGERAFDYLSYVFLGWRTTGGTWQNHVIEKFVMDQLKDAGYTYSANVDKTEAADDDYAWLSYYDSSARVWSPEYAKLEVTQAPAGSESLISRVNVETYSFNPVTDTYIDYYNSIYGVSDIDEMWDWITEKDDLGNRINVLNGEEAKLGKRTYLAWQTCFTEPGGTAPEDAAGLEGEAVYVGVISTSGGSRVSSIFQGAEAEATLAGKVLLSDSSLSNTFAFAQKVGAIAVMSSSSLNDYNLPSIDGVLQEPFMYSARYASGTGSANALAAMNNGKPIVEWQCSYDQKAALKELLEKAVITGTPVRIKSVSIGDIYTMNGDDPRARGQVVGMAEIKGASKPDERILICAHVQEPGSNDNATGVAALLEMATRVKKLIDEGRIERPARTITFLWGDEMNMGTLWMSDHDRSGLVAVLDMDMVGEDPAKTGGVMRIEKTPDPSATYNYTLDVLPDGVPYYDETYNHRTGSRDSFVRLPDSHTLWGAGSTNGLFRSGHYLNDLYMAVTQEVINTVDGEFSVEVCPYEGGSDHSTFLRANIPALLTWHFTDYTYHSSVDTLIMSSAREMRNVDIVTFATAYLIADTTDDNPELAEMLMQVVYDAALERFAKERENTDHHRLYTTRNSKPIDAEITNEVEALNAWGDWYIEAVSSPAQYLLSGKGDDYAALESQYAEQIDSVRDEAVAYAENAIWTRGTTVKVNPSVRIALKMRSTYQLNTVTDGGLYEYTSSNPGIARVDKNGLVTPVRAGTAIISVKLIDGSGLVSTATVNVTP
ncbi:MAG: M28 family peptidase [Clostridiales Family XIII bacterium]|nr:M28 family peptidase [Clostridiales Family XIII bacterium]